MDSVEYSSMVKHLDRIVNLNLPVYEIIKDQVINYNDISLKKFNDYCNEVSRDIDEGRSSRTNPWTSDEEFSIYITVLYYRLVRNLISVRELLKLAKPESKHFEAYEFSIAILLRSGLCDCKDFYKVDLDNHVSGYLKDSFKHLVTDIRRNMPESEEKESQISYFTRLRDGIGTSTCPLREPIDKAKLSYIEKYKKECEYAYSIYSKYDHFSLYEISPMLKTVKDRKNLMYTSIMIQVPAIAQLLAYFKYEIHSIPSQSIDEHYQMFNEWNVNYHIKEN